MRHVVETLCMLWLSWWLGYAVRKSVHLRAVRRLIGGVWAYRLFVTGGCWERLEYEELTQAWLLPEGRRVLIYCTTNPYITVEDHRPAWKRAAARLAGED